MSTSITSMAIIWTDTGQEGMLKLYRSRALLRCLGHGFLFWFFEIATVETVSQQSLSRLLFLLLLKIATKGTTLTRLDKVPAILSGMKKESRQSCCNSVAWGMVPQLIRPTKQKPSHPDRRSLRIICIYEPSQPRDEVNGRNFLCHLLHCLRQTSGNSV